MARTYDRSLVDTIASKAHVINDNGLAVELRPLPDDDRPHALDPRVLAATLPKLASPGVDVAMDDVMAMRKRPIKPTYPIHTGKVTRATRLMWLAGRGIPVHIWTPENARADAPLFVYLHGGGFCYGCVEERDPMLSYLAERAGCIVAYPEYRLAPENPFPAAVDDCAEGILWLAEHADEFGFDPAKLAVAGDSAGGSLTNAMVMRLVDQLPVKLAVTMYAMIDAWPPTRNSDFSYDAYDHLPEQEAACFNRIDRIKNAGVEPFYVDNDLDLLKHPEISAWHADDVSMFPRTVVAYSEFDFLRCQNERWARRLQDEGVDVRCVRYCGCDHGFLERFATMPQAEDFIDLVAGEMERAFDDCGA